MAFTRTDVLIPFEDGQAVSRGWTAATGNRPLGVTWHWTATFDLALCRRLLGGANAERKGEASAHYGIGRTLVEGVDRYVSIEDRSWHAGLNQTLQTNGQALTDGRFKAARATIGIETVNPGYARENVVAGPDWIQAAVPNGRMAMRVAPWPDEQIAMMIAVGREIIARWSNISFRDHHGHHDICPGYKVDVGGFPFARVLRGIYNLPTIPDVWTPLWTARQRQDALRVLGFLDAAGVDGDWGRISDGALRRFQRDSGLVEDGMWTTFVNWKVYDLMVARGTAATFFTA